MSWNSGPKSGEGWDIIIVFIHPSMKGAKVLNQVWGGVGYNNCVYSYNFEGGKSTQSSLGKGGI